MFMHITHTLLQHKVFVCVTFQKHDHTKVRHSGARHDGLHNCAARCTILCYTKARRCNPRHLWASPASPWSGAFWGGVSHVSPAPCLSHLPILLKNHPHRVFIICIEMYCIRWCRNRRSIERAARVAQPNDPIAIFCRPELTKQVTFLEHIAPISWGNLSGYL